MKVVMHMTKHYWKTFNYVKMFFLIFEKLNTILKLKH